MIKTLWVPVLFDQTSHILIRRREEVNGCTLAANSGSKEPEPQFGKKGERNENESGPRFKKLPPSLSMPTKSISHPHPNVPPLPVFLILFIVWQLRCREKVGR